MGTGNLHDTVDQSWAPYHLLRQREQRPDLIGGSEEIGVVHHRDRKRFADTATLNCQFAGI
jgi:hypothetical protein